MQYLLSLPPHVVDSFHKLTGRDAHQWFCTSDPVGHRVGSGGGTIWLLHRAYEAACAEAAACDRQVGSFDEWLGAEKRILLHAGGQSRRLPAYAPTGKVLTPLPVFRWSTGQTVDQLLLDVQMPFYERLMEKAPEHLHTLICSGDVFLRTTQPLAPIPQADIVCYGLWASPHQAARHGLFMMRRDGGSQLDFMLQKPSIEEQMRYATTHYSLMDIGAWLLSDRAVKLLERRSVNAQGDTCFYDLYSDFGYALGQNARRTDPELNSLNVAIVPLTGGEFYHFGTNAELLSSTIAIQNLEKDQRLAVQQNIKRHPSIFKQNVDFTAQLGSDNQDIWVENSCVGQGWKLSSRHVLTGIPHNSWNVVLSEGQCIDIVPIGSQAYALRPYGFHDAFRGATSDADTLFLGKPFSEWLSSHGLSAERFGTYADLQTAPLFPLFENADAIEPWLRWMLADRPHEGDCTAEDYLAMKRLSAEDITAQANLERLFASRRELLAENLPSLARNWQKSVFYRLNLRHAAGKFSTLRLPMPFPLPEQAPFIQRMNDAMFRSERLRLDGDDDGARHMAERAHQLLREGLMSKAIENKCAPRQSVYSDQIVWSRSPVRIDLAGGWTDTPPYSLARGGNVLNAAITLNGQPPLQVYVKPSREPLVICRSIDLGSTERIETYEQLADYNHVGSPFSIPKAALALCGFLPQFGTETYSSLREQLEAFGSGIEITLLSAIPAGSGLGTSSILAATVLGALSNFCSLGWDSNEVCRRVLILEQLLTTGGGWQDQYGGVLPGVKLLQSVPGLSQYALARYLPSTIFTSPTYKDCHLLYYTGLTRTAKTILAEIVRGMFLNDTQTLRLLETMKEHTQEMYEALQRLDFESYGRLLRETWRQNCLLDSGTCPPEIARITAIVDDLCAGYKLPGAGGGGYLYMLAKSPEAAERIRQRLQSNPPTHNARFVDMAISETGLQVSRS